MRVPSWVLPMMLISANALTGADGYGQCLNCKCCEVQKLTCPLIRQLRRPEHASSKPWGMTQSSTASPDSMAHTTTTATSSELDQNQYLTTAAASQGAPHGPIPIISTTDTDLSKTGAVLLAGLWDVVSTNDIRSTTLSRWRSMLTRPCV